MPVKARRSKRRTDHRAELEAWAGLFKCGYDYFDELAGWGQWPATDSADQTKRSAAREAWQRLGRTFLDEWNEGGLHGRPMATGVDGEPWALIEFGEPSNAR